MTAFLGWLVENAVVTALLALVVCTACRPLRHRPAIQHALWLVILLKFVMPPVFAWPWSLRDLVDPWFPSMVAQRADNSGEMSPEDKGDAEPTPLSAMGATPVTELPALSAPALAANAPAKSEPPLPTPQPAAASTTTKGDAPTMAVVPTLFLAWCLGCVAAFLMHLRRILKHRAMIRQGVAAPQHLTGAIGEMSQLLGQRPLRAVIVNRIKAPFLWCLGRLQLVWPESLSSEQDVRRSRGILAHELAHARRGDHWVAWLQLAAGLIWWWNPVFWFVCRRLRETAEMACDAVALGALPDQRRAYAGVLLELSSSIKSGAPAPVLGVGAGTPSCFERRLSMILSDCVTGKLTSWGILLAIGFALVALPGWSRGQEQPQQESVQNPPAVPRRDPSSANINPKEPQPVQRTRVIPLEKVDSKILLEPGNQFAVEVTGSTDGVVSGTDLYFWDSSLAAAAVHAGLVKPGETAVVTVTVVKCPKSGVGSRRNGVASLPFDTPRATDTALLLQRLPINKVENPRPAASGATTRTRDVALGHERLHERQTTLGADHPRTLQARNDLAEAYRAAGDLEKAMGLHEQALVLRTTKLGADHPDTLQSIANLAATYLAAGQAEKARALLKKGVGSGGKETFRQELASQPPRPGGASGAFPAATSHDGKILAVADKAGEVLLVERATGQSLRRVHLGESAKIVKLEFTADNKRLIIHSEQGAVWDVGVATGKILPRSESRQPKFQPSSDDKQPAPPPRAPDQLRLLPLKNAKARDVEAALKKVTQDVKISIDERTNSIILSGPSDRVEQIQELIQRLDSQPSPVAPTKADPVPGTQAYEELLRSLHAPAAPAVEKAKPASPPRLPERQESSGSKEARRDLAQLQGTWVVVDWNCDEKIHPQPSGRFPPLVIDGTHLSWRDVDYRFDLDPAAHPKQIDLTALTAGFGTLEGEKRLWIYGMAADRLVLAWHHTSGGTRRPTTLGWPTGSGNIMLTFKREPEKPAKFADSGKENGSGLAAERYTGASQLMIVGRDGVVSYDDTPMGICHMEITADGSLKADFPDKKLGRGKWDNVTLGLSSKEPRTVWTAVIQNDTYKATAIPYSPKAFVLRLEITNNGKLIAGAQQFYSIEPK